MRRIADVTARGRSATASVPLRRMGSGTATTTASAEIVAPDRSVAVTRDPCTRTLVTGVRSRHSMPSRRSSTMLS